MKVKNDKIEFKLIFLVLTLFLLPNVIATDGIGVASPYWNENPLKMHPGETATVNMNLQITAGSPDAYFKAEISNDGKGIATLNDRDLIYKVKSGEKVDVPIKITIPEDTAFGETRMIQIVFSQVEQGGEGMLILQTAVEGKFPVQIVVQEETTFYNQPEEEESTMWYWIIGSLIVVVVIFFLVRKKIKEN